MKYSIDVSYESSSLWVITSTIQPMSEFIFRNIKIIYLHFPLFHNTKMVQVFDILPHAGIILCMRPTNERRRYNVTSSLIGWAHS